MIRARIITYFLSFTQFSDQTENVPVRLVGMEIWWLLIPNFVILNVSVIYSFMRSVFGSNFPHLMVNGNHYFPPDTLPTNTVNYFSSLDCKRDTKFIGSFYLGI